MSFQSALKLGIVAWYQVNRTYVATVLCENKDKPQMKCCGKCYLRKQLNKTEGSGSQQSKSLSDEWVEFIPAKKIEIALHYFEPRSEFQSSYHASIGYDPIASVFHPPPVC